MGSRTPECVCCFVVCIILATPTVRQALPQMPDAGQRVRSPSYPGCVASRAVGTGRGPSRLVPLGAPCILLGCCPADQRCQVTGGTVLPSLLALVTSAAREDAFVRPAPRTPHLRGPGVLSSPRPPRPRARPAKPAAGLKHPLCAAVVRSAPEPRTRTASQLISSGGN